MRADMTDPEETNAKRLRSLVSVVIDFYETKLEDQATEALRLARENENLRAGIERYQAANAKLTGDMMDVWKLVASHRLFFAQVSQLTSPTRAKLQKIIASFEVNVGRRKAGDYDD